MTPAARRSLNDLLNGLDLERVPVDGQTCQRLLDQARKHVLTASAGLDHHDAEGAFQIAYDACRKVCLALVLSMGLRPRGESEHRTTFEAAAAIADSVGGRTAVDDAADLRMVRNNTECRGVEVSQAEARDAIDIAGELLVGLAVPITAILAAQS